MTPLLTAAACICVLALNFLAMAKVMRDTALPESRRLGLLAAIWLVPVIGAAVVLLMRPRNA